MKDESWTTFFWVIPCFKESKRLPRFLEELAPALDAYRERVRVLVVDDGSGEREVEKLVEIVAKANSVYPIFEDVLSLGKNGGKGFAIREGWERAPRDCRYLGFVDADGAVNAEGVLRLMEAALDGERSEVVIGSRRSEGARADRLWWRRAASAAFATLTRNSYGIQVLDTQCGCKLVPANWYRELADRFVEDRFGFDIELLLKAEASGLGIREIGLDWEERAGSKLGFGKASQLFLDVGLRRIGKRR